MKWGDLELELLEDKHDQISYLGVTRTDEVIVWAGTERGVLVRIELDKEEGTKEMKSILSPIQ